jgi:flavin reductase (DIM6/NTAB) family NADH-FMN oxidoreductase RutF
MADIASKSTTRTKTTKMTAHNAIFLLNWSFFIIFQLPLVSICICTKSVPIANINAVVKFGVVICVTALS